MSVVLAMRFTEVEIGSMDALVGDDRWVMEQKLDGTRALAVITGAGIRWYGAGGARLAHTAATQHLGKFEVVLGSIIPDLPETAGDELVLDGEIMTGTGEYHIFDIPYLRYRGEEVVAPSMPYSVRRAALEAPEMDNWLADGPIYIVRSARTRAAKAALVEAVRAAGGEGLMAKHVDGTYRPGVRTDMACKLKFTKTADVVVTEVNRPDARHGSAKLGVYLSPGVLRSVGGCSLIGKPEVAVGDVIEVAYLYWTGTNVYQPRMLRVRTDKSPAECGLDQFPAYSREIV